MDERDHEGQSEPGRTDNPWSLTQRQAEAMDAMVKHGCRKRVARATGLSEETIKSHLKRASKRMPGYRNGLQRFIAWDRWRRGQMTSMNTEAEPARPAERTR